MQRAMTNAERCPRVQSADEPPKKAKRALLDPEPDNESNFGDENNFVEESGAAAVAAQASHHNKHHSGDMMYHDNDCCRHNHDPQQMQPGRCSVPSLLKPQMEERAKNGGPDNQQNYYSFHCVAEPQNKRQLNP
jgi:hypothetical protein